MNEVDLFDLPPLPPANAQASQQENNQPAAPAPPPHDEQPPPARKHGSFGPTSTGGSSGPSF